MAKSISWRKLIQKFRTIEWSGPYSGGRHFFMTKGAQKIHIPNPHKSDISGPLVAEVLRQANVPISDWEHI